MCGIVGILHFDSEQPINPENITKMIEVLRHRGPDDTDYYIGNRIGLGFCRLAIIDLAYGRQPIQNEDGHIRMICNGEIYNYLELRKDLLSKGHLFRTSSDSEVILHLYEEYSENFLEYLRGVFALALWDETRQQLILARDRLGIKPLYYYWDKQELIFASEIKSILSVRLPKWGIDPVAVHHLFCYGFIVSPHTLFPDIYQLPAGNYLTLTGSQIRLSCYWDIQFPSETSAQEILSPNDWTDILLDKLSESVRLYMRSDVRLGSWLSGGLDSSIITALMCRSTDNEVPAFSVLVDHPHYDEFSHQRTLDSDPRYHIHASRVICRTNDFNLLPKAIWHCETPFTAGTEIARFVLSRFTAGSVKSVLTGEGADELFGGYRWYRIEKGLQYMAFLPSTARKVLAALLVKKWPGLSQMLSVLSLPPSSRYATHIAPFTTRYHVSQLWSADLLSRFGSAPAYDLAIPTEFAGWSWFHQLQYLDIKFRLADCIVHHLDRCSMAYSLETRVPFLDHPLVELSCRIPVSLKLKGWTDKFILRKTMGDQLLPEIARRRKFGLSVPITDWFRSDLPEFARYALSMRKVNDLGYFQADSVTSLLKQHQSRKADHARILLAILGIQLWHILFLEQDQSMLTNL